MEKDAIVLRETQRVLTGDMGVDDLVRLMERLDVQPPPTTDRSIAPDERCIALRANDNQCTRRRKSGASYCGTHCKNLPHGTLACSKTKTREVVAQDIGGIVYYVDDVRRVYCTEDVLLNMVNPRIIATVTGDSTLEWI